MHVVDVSEGPSGFAAVIRDGDAMHELPLRGPFAWRITGPRTCAGKWAWLAELPVAVAPMPAAIPPMPAAAAGGFPLQQGHPPQGWVHVPCPTQAPVGDEATCLPCLGLEVPECVFEPRCARDPAGCTCKAFQGVAHVVYLAFHGTLPKVGMTQARRVAARLREQGADAWLLVQGHHAGDPAKALDRAQARAIERQVAFLHGVPEWRSHRETLPQLARPVPWEQVQVRAEAWARSLAARFDVDPRLHRITDHPCAQPLPAVPSRLPPEGVHAGTWLGGKGGHLFYERAPSPGLLPVGTVAVGALRRMDLVGRHLEVM